jgi:predicted small lipoprotein YifL
MKFAGPWVFIFLAGLLSGCGQKGPLVMPDAQKHKRSIPAPPATPAKKFTSRDAATAPAPGAAATPTAPASPSTPTPADPTSHP